MTQTISMMEGSGFVDNHTRKPSEALRNNRLLVRFPEQHRHYSHLKNSGGLHLRGIPRIPLPWVLRQLLNFSGNVSEPRNLHS